MNVISSFLRRACLVTTCALAASDITAAIAQTVLVDFGNNADQYRGVPVSNPDSNGNYWNSIQPGLLVENFVDIDNVATTIDLGWDTPVGTDSYNGPSGGPTDKLTLETDVLFTDIDAAALGNLGGALAAAFDYATGPISPDPVIGNKTRFQIQGLDPGKTYDLTFFGSHIYSFDATTLYSVYTDDTYSTLVDSATLDHQDLADFTQHNRDRVATISGVAPQTDDILYVEFVGLQTGDLGYLNAMQFVGNAAPGLTGDYNDDGSVDAADYTTWRNHLGQPGETLANRSDSVTGNVQDADYDVWKMNFGNSGSGSVASIAAPEPSAWSLLMLTSAGAAIARSRRR
jgi:hypothetical protein